MGNETRAITIIADTRQHDRKHDLKNTYFERNGIKVVNSKLPAGDYALLTDMSRVIDTKRNLQELVGNLIQDHERFRREADFCRDNGIELIVLVEERGIHSLEDVRRWVNPRLRKWKKDKWLGRKVNPKPPTDNITLMKIMWTFGKEHHVRWEFCSPEEAGKRVIELLTEEKQLEKKNQTD